MVAHMRFFVAFADQGRFYNFCRHKSSLVTKSVTWWLEHAGIPAGQTTGQTQASKGIRDSHDTLTFQAHHRESPDAPDGIKALAMTLARRYKMQFVVMHCKAGQAL